MCLRFQISEAYFACTRMVMMLVLICQVTVRVIRDIGQHSYLFSPDHQIQITSLVEMMLPAIIPA